MLGHCPEGKRSENAQEGGDRRTAHEQEARGEGEVDRDVLADAEREQNAGGCAGADDGAAGSDRTTPAAADKQITESAVVGENESPSAVSRAALPKARVDQQASK